MSKLHYFKNFQIKELTEECQKKLITKIIKRYRFERYGNYNDGWYDLDHQVCVGIEVDLKAKKSEARANGYKKALDYCY